MYSFEQQYQISNKAAGRTLALHRYKVWTGVSIAKRVMADIEIAHQVYGNHQSAETIY